MKTICTIMTILVLFACDVDENTATNPINDDFDPNAPGVTLLKQGMMMGAGGHTVAGTVKIYDSAGKTVIVLDPFESQNGPDLKVYLSEDVDASRYINLGPLKSTQGKQSYEVSGMPDLTKYPYVLIWCEKFTVIFGKAAVM